MMLPFGVSRCIEHVTNIQAPAEIVWNHITEVDIVSFSHPTYFSLLGIPKPLRAEVTKPGVGGRRTRRFLQTAAPSARKSRYGKPHKRYDFTFQADPGFRVAFLLDLSAGPFQMKAGSYRIVAGQAGVQLFLTSQYELQGFFGLCLRGPVWLVLNLFQRYLLRGIKANAERDAGHA